MAVIPGNITFLGINDYELHDTVVALNTRYLIRQCVTGGDGKRTATTVNAILSHKTLLNHNGAP